MTDFLDWDELAADVNDLLGEFQQIILARPSTLPPVYDDDTGVATPVAPAVYFGSGAVFDYKQIEVTGTVIARGDQRLLLSPLQQNGTPMPQPTTSDDVMIGSTLYAVVNPGRVAPAGVTVLYDLQLRGVG